MNQTTDNMMKQGGEKLLPRKKMVSNKKPRPNTKKEEKEKTDERS